MEWTSPTRDQVASCDYGGGRFGLFKNRFGADNWGDRRFFPHGKTFYRMLETGLK